MPFDFWYSQDFFVHIRPVRQPTLVKCSNWAALANRNSI